MRDDDSGVAIDAVAAVWRSQLRRRWRAWVALSLLLALGTGAGMAFLVGARRTASAFDRHAEASGFPDVNTSHGQPPAEVESTIAGFDGVASHATVVGFVGFVEDLDPTFMKYFIGSWSTPIPRVGQTLQAGRYPRLDQSSEVLAVGKGVEAAGIEPGDELTVQLFTSDFSAMVPTTVTVVGTGDDPLGAVADATYDRSALYFTPAFTQANAAQLQAWSASGFITAPGPDAEAKLISQLTEVGWSIDETRQVAQARVQDAIRPLVSVLGLLGVLILATTLLLVGLTIARQSDASRAEHRIALSLGFTRGQLRGLDVLSALSVATPGTVLATALAVAMSPLFPTGAVRRLDPARGAVADLTVLGAGAGAVLAILVLLGLGRARSTIGTSAGMARPFLSSRPGLGPSITSGLGLAVGGTTRQRRQFWTTVALSAVAVSLLVSGLAFVAGVGRLTEEPARYGAGWDLTTRNAFGDVPPDDVRALTADDPDIEGLAGGTLNTFIVNDELNVPVMAFLPITADLWPTVIDGAVPRNDDEVLVGVDVLSAIGADIGDDIRLASVYSPTDDPTSVEIVGTAVFPSIELAGLDPTRLGQGIAIGWESYQSIIGGDEGVGDPAPDMIFFDLADGVDAHTVIDRYPEGVPDVSGFAPTEWLTSLAPAEVLETDRSTGLIWSVIGLLAFVVAAGLGHALSRGVRQHRRDYATLKVLGFTSRQVLGSVTWQSTTPVVVALLLALPLGTALGRWWWRILAGLIGVIDTPVLPVGSLLVVVTAALGGASLLALRPGLHAARTPAATCLHDE